MPKKRSITPLASEKAPPSIASAQKPERIELSRATFVSREECSSPQQTISTFQLHIPIKGIRQIRRALHQLLLEIPPHARPMILPIED